MRIGELAKLTGVAARTLRFYADEGLFGTLPRTAKDYRDFPPQGVEVVQFIQQAQSSGFSLAEVKLLLELQADAPSTCLQVGDLLDRKISQLEAQLEQILTLHQKLLELREACRAVSDQGPCPVVGSQMRITKSLRR